MRTPLSLLALAGLLLGGTALEAGPRPGWDGSPCQVYAPPRREPGRVSDAVLREVRRRGRARVVVLFRRPAADQVRHSASTEARRRRETLDFTRDAVDRYAMECTPIRDLVRFDRGFYRPLWVIHGAAMDATLRQLSVLARSGWVEAIVRVAAFPLPGDGVPARRIEWAPEVEGRTAERRIGILDSGIRADRPLLADRVQDYRDATRRPGNPGLGDGGVFDSWGRGTAVATHALRFYGDGVRFRVARIFRDLADERGPRLDELLQAFQWMVEAEERPEEVLVSFDFMGPTTRSPEGQALSRRLFEVYRELGVTLKDSDGIASWQPEPPPVEITPVDQGTAASRTARTPSKPAATRGAGDAPSEGLLGMDGGTADETIEQAIVAAEDVVTESRPAPERSRPGPPSTRSAPRRPRSKGRDDLAAWATRWKWGRRQPLAPVPTDPLTGAAGTIVEALTGRNPFAELERVSKLQNGELQDDATTNDDDSNPLGRKEKSDGNDS